jgi:hypothetical protein
MGEKARISRFSALFFIFLKLAQACSSLAAHSLQQGVGHPWALPPEFSKIPAPAPLIASQPGHRRKDPKADSTL